MTARRALSANLGVASWVKQAGDTRVLDGVTYELVFEDQFPGTTINASNWNVIEPGVNWGGGENDIFDPTYAMPYVADGALHLPVYYDETEGWFQSGVLGADQIARTNLQTWAAPCIIEVVATFPVGVIPDGETWPSQNNEFATGLWGSIWTLWGYPGLYGLTAPDGNWPGNGEKDILELQRGRYRNPTGAITDMAWANMHQQLNSKAQEDPPVAWDTQAPKQLEGTYTGVPITSLQEQFYDSSNGDVLTHKTYIDGDLIGEWFGGTTSSWAGESGDPRLNNSTPVELDRVDWAGELASDPQDFDNGPIGSPFEQDQYLILASAMKGGGPVSQDSVIPWTENSGQEVIIHSVKVYKPVT